MIRGEAPAVPENPFFVRKILNRLPERRHSTFSIPEAVAVAAVAIASVVIICLELHTLVAAPDPAEFNPALLFTAAGTLLGLTLIKAMPLLRRCWN